MTTEMREERKTVEFLIIWLRNIETFSVLSCKWHWHKLSLHERGSVLECCDQLKYLWLSSWSDLAEWALCAWANGETIQRGWNSAGTVSRFHESRTKTFHSSVRKNVPLIFLRKFMWYRVAQEILFHLLFLRGDREVLWVCFEVLFSLFRWVKFWWIIWAITSKDHGSEATYQNIKKLYSGIFRRKQTPFRSISLPY